MFLESPVLEQMCLLNIKHINILQDPPPDLSIMCPLCLCVWICGQLSLFFIMFGLWITINQNHKLPLNTVQFNLSIHLKQSCRDWSRPSFSWMNRRDDKGPAANRESAEEGFQQNSSSKTENKNHLKTDLTAEWTSSDCRMSSNQRDRNEPKSCIKDVTNFSSRKTQRTNVTLASNPNTQTQAAG